MSQWSRIEQLDSAVSRRLAQISALRKALELCRGDLRDSVAREMAAEIARLEREVDRDIDSMVDLQRGLDARMGSEGDRVGLPVWKGGRAT